MDAVKPDKRSWTQRRSSPRALRAENTRANVVMVARELFAESGYHSVGVREICEKAGVSRGTLVHYFSTKEALFRAVFELVEDELGEEIRKKLARSPTGDAWTTFRRSIRFFLDASAARTDVQRITLIDGPSVLGWATWRELEATFSLGSFIAAIQASIDAGRIRKTSADTLAHLILGSVMEAGLLIANANQGQRKQREVMQSLDQWLASLEVTGTS